MTVEKTLVLQGNIEATEICCSVRGEMVAFYMGGRLFVSHLFRPP